MAQEGFWFGVRRQRVALAFIGWRYRSTGYGRHVLDVGNGDLLTGLYVPDRVHVMLEGLGVKEVTRVRPAVMVDASG